MGRGKGVTCTPCDKVLISFICILSALFMVLLALRFTNTFPHNDFKETRCTITKAVFELTRCGEEGECDHEGPLPALVPGMMDRRPPPHPERRPEDMEDMDSKSHDGKRSGSHDGRRSGSHDGGRPGSHEERPDRDHDEFRPRPGPGGKRPDKDECAPHLGVNVEVSYGDYIGKIYFDDWSFYTQSKYTISDCPSDKYKFEDYNDDDDSSSSQSRDSSHSHGKGRKDWDRREDRHGRHRRSEDDMESREDSHRRDGHHRRRYWPRGNCTWKTTPSHSGPNPTRPGDQPASTTATPEPERVFISPEMRDLMGEIKEALYFQEEFDCYMHIDTNNVVVQEPPMYPKRYFCALLLPVAIGVLIIVLIVKKICQAKNPKQVGDVDKKDAYKVPQGMVEVSNKAIEAGVGEKDPIVLGPEVVPEGDLKTDVVLMSGPVVMEKQAEALAALSPRDLIKDTVPPVDVERMIESPPPPYGDSSFA